MNISNIASDLAYAKPEVQMPKQHGASREASPEIAAVQGQDAISISTKKSVGDVYVMPGAKKQDVDEIMKQGLKQANKTLEASNRYIEREIHEKTHAVMYKLKDSLTNEVIAEFPPKKIQDMVAKMWEFAGLFVDEKA